MKIKGAIVTKKLMFEMTEDEASAIGWVIHNFSGPLPPAAEEFLNEIGNEGVKIL